MIAFARAILIATAALIGAAVAFAVAVVEGGVASPAAVVHVDRALTRKRCTRRCIGAARTRARTCAAAAAAILTCRAVCNTAIAFVAIATRVVARTRTELVRPTGLVGAAETLAIFMVVSCVAFPAAVICID